MLVYLLLIFVILSFIISFSFFKKKENKKTELVFKTNSDLYDKEYVDIYDTVTYDYYRTQKEIQTILPTTNKNSYVLDIGSGTGHYVHELNNHKVKSIGMDQSTAMVQAF
jgi:ubiquinone/menaquinone biosynthesis C-methylase UbiE